MKKIRPIHWAEYQTVKQSVFFVFFFILFAMLSIPLFAWAQELKTEFQDVSPKYINTGDKFEGICVDILQELNKGLREHGLTIAFPKNFTPPKRIRSHLLEGTTDLHCGAARSKAREKKFVFSRQPLYSVNTVVVGRADETLEILSMDDLVRSQAIVSSVYGTNTHKLLSSQNGLQQGPMPKESEGGLSMVERGRIRFFVYHDLGLNWTIKKLQKESLFTVQPAVLRHYSHWMMYSPHLEEDIRERIENELQKLHDSGSIEAIIAKYSSHSRVN